MRRVRRKGGSKEKVFGCDLLEHLTASSQEIPLVLRSCSEFVEEHGIVDGIYRLSGVSSNIQKLRSEFESDGGPDMNKDVYLQDIHCVSSLCKAYFRELPNPLLTYQLYDKFAEAVAIQLEEERLVKIKDVLKELPAEHYRTLEFLMRHLVKMASYSSETNMHARNLAIVWAPNLLRSKDIEASGFNGTAAFMEVRVQSIVVEFILTHVPQLFPEQGVSTERRKSLPSPSVMPSQEMLFRSALPNFGNISPGDGPLPIRPYHAIIEGTDKRKGSLKGRKWMSIFNIGGRIQDQRRRHKHSTKEKDRAALRPARSMDSLSAPFPNEGSRSSGQPPPSTTSSPLVTTVSKPSDGVAVGGLGGSEYAVTYRRGTGLVTGTTGTPGSYTALDPEGLVVPASEGVQTRSPGLSCKASRRAAMHITGPTLVTVPLHITSNLALGVLQGGGSDRVVIRGRDKEGDNVEAKGEKIGKRESRVTEWNIEDSKNMEEEEKCLIERESLNLEKVDGESVEKEGTEEKPEEEVRVDHKEKQQEMEDQDVSREQTNTCSKEEEKKDEDVEDSDDNDYIEMKGEKHCSAAQHGCDVSVNVSHVLNSTEVGREDHELSGYVQDNFDFLDQMDCSVMDHMDTSVPFQMEFSVEPPGHSDDEYEIMKETPSSQDFTEQQSFPEWSPDVNAHKQAVCSPRPLSLDLSSRHTKSLSLPYVTSPIHGPGDSSSDGEVSGDDDEILSDCEEDNSMFIQSLPSDFFFNNLTRMNPTADELQMSEPEERLSPNSEVCGNVASGNQEELEEEDKVEEKETVIEVQDDGACCGINPLEDKMDSSDPEQHIHLVSTSEEFSLQNKNNELKPGNVKELEIHQSFFPPPETSHESLRESPDVSSEDTYVIPAQHSEVCVEENPIESEDIGSQSDLEMPESDEKVPEKEAEGIAENVPERCDDLGNLMCGGGDFWYELEDVVCEVIEDEESKCEEELEAAEVHVAEDEEKETGALEENSVETNKNRTEMREEDELLDKIEEKLSDPESEADETNLPSSELEKVEDAFSEEDQANKEVVSEENTQKLSERSLTRPGGDKPLPETRADEEELKGNQMCESSLGGVERKLVTSKHPKVYQVKAVPVVPPKPQHCKITALTLRHQQKQREKRDAERLTETPQRTEQERFGSAEQLRNYESSPRKEKTVLLMERRRDGAEGVVWDSTKNSPLSMCFDEAVAIATMRREKERAREGEVDSEGSGKGNL